jgi:hypothetical protein
MISNHHDPRNLNMLDRTIGFGEDKNMIFKMVSLAAFAINIIRKIECTYPQELICTNLNHHDPNDLKYVAQCWIGPCSGFREEDDNLIFKMATLTTICTK